MLSVIGFSVFIAMFGGIQWAIARRWRYLSQSYAREIEPSVEKRYMQSAVLLGLGGFNSLKGIVSIGLHRSGVSFSVMLPFSLFHHPLFVPYSDIQGWGTTWYIDAPSTELQFRHAPDVKMIVPAEQAEWIRNFAGQKMQLTDDSPPDGKAGRGWHAFSLINAAMSLAMIVWLAYYVLTQ